MLPLHKVYKNYDLITKGKFEDVDDILTKIREHWTSAGAEGSTGLIKSYIDRNTNLMVGYAWATKTKEKYIWNFFIFSYGYEF